MRKWTKLGLILALLFALALSTIPVALTIVILPGLQPNVGWNSGVISYAPSPVALIGPTVKPCVGWNA